MDDSPIRRRSGDLYTPNERILLMFKPDRSSCEERIFVDGDHGVAHPRIEVDILLNMNIDARDVNAVGTIISVPIVDLSRS
jgi:hypothetical protein